LKRFLAISIILHALVIAIGLFLIPHKEKEVKPFIAQLVTPEEVPVAVEKPRPAEKRPKPRIRRYDNIRTGETEAPKKLSAVPKGKEARKGRTIRREPDQKTPGSSQYGIYRTIPSKTKDAPLSEKIFDRSVIDKTAHAGKGRVRSVKSGGVSLDIGYDKHYGWVQRVSEKLAAVWRYPRELAARRIFSDVDVRITFKKDGSLDRAELIRTSGYRSLDDSVLKALNDANPYWPLPDDWNENELTIIGHFYVP
jgi:periplasmic protein TonB